MIDRCCSERYTWHSCNIWFRRDKDNVKMHQSIIGLVVEFIVAIDEARVRFTDDASYFLPELHTSSSFCRVTNTGSILAKGDSMLLFAVWCFGLL
ncbi:uncharacterized protein BO97DRAFT_59007 [Aspergillus homomorphus CBS 101889]|uniref:Uncharacterized protein n=1 Tax=Aspergillus homomorphus (strain CBS 101889) TaxID=1450537 RepID=A0A395HYE3_ASPHC|nr:hypothetical protein BO97DRAFT_59007 [Aspergillus homomorphus CBS 101889]RAL12529.1 hypothetical protein BO97DRAFT_59007 [Aspergillus homomorphus CBS 101889]